MIQTVIDIIQKIVESSIVTKLTVGFISFLASYFLPILPIIAVCLAAIILDTIYGIRVAIKLNRKITSGRSWSGACRKLRDTMVMLSMARGVELYILGGSFFSGAVLVGTVAIVVTVTELLSIVENMNTLNPDGPWRVMSHLLKKKGSEFTGIDIKEFDNVKQDKTGTTPNI